MQAIVNLPLANWQAMQADCAYFSVGLHPWDLPQVELQAALESVAEATTCTRCLAVGEIGCDKARPIPLTMQLQALQAQLKLADARQLPVVLHNVRSLQEILITIKQVKTSVPFVFHGFMGGEATVQQVLRMGGLLSFGKALFGHAATKDAFSKIPPDSVFFETDDEDDLSIEAVYQQAVRLTGRSMEEWKTIVQKNFTRTFGH